MQRLALLTAATAAVIFSTSAHAAVIAQYDFEAASEPSGPVYTIASVDSNSLSSATNFVLSTAIQPSGSTLRPTGIYDDSTTFGFDGTGSFQGGLVVSHASTETTVALSATKFAEFSVTPSATYELDLESFAFRYRTSNNGNSQALTLRSSIDSYATDINSQLVTATFTNYSFTLTDPSFQNLQNTTTFRVYFTDTSTNADRNHRVDTVVLTATVALVPEPTSVLAIVAGAVLLALRRRARA